VVALPVTHPGASQNRGFEGIAEGAVSLTPVAKFRAAQPFIAHHGLADNRGGCAKRCALPRPLMNCSR